MDDLGLAIFSILFRQLIVYQDKFFSLLSNELGTFFLLVTTLYIVIVGYKVLMGSFKDRTKEAVISIILVALLHGMIIDNDSAYMKSFTGVIYATVMQTSGYVASLGESTSYQGLFLSVGRLAEASTETSEAISSRQPSSSFITFSEVKVGTALFILQILFLVVYLVFIALFTVGIFAIVILLSVSAVPIFFAAFKETRFIFFTWLKTLLNYMLFPIFVSMALGICLFGMESAVEKMASMDIEADGIFNKHYLSAIIWAALSIYMMNKATEFAAALTGDTASSTGGITGAAGMAGGALYAGTGGAALNKAQQMGMTAAGKGLGKAGSAAAGAASKAYSKLRGIK